MFFAKRKKQLRDGLDKLCQSVTELERSQVQLETLYETGRAMGEIHNLEEVLDETLNITRRVLGYPACSVLLLSAKNDRLFLKARIQSGEKTIYKDSPVVDLKGIYAQVLKTGSAVRIADTQLDPTPVLSLPGARSQLVAPLIARGAVVGVLSVESLELGAFLDKDVKMLSILANSTALENAVMHKQMEEIAITDPLTGVYNSRFFAAKLEDELKRAHRFRYPVSLALINVDYFKKTKDRYGRQVCKEVLRDLVAVFQKCIRETDILSRCDGDEFEVIMPQTDKRDSFIIGERIRAMVGETTFGGSGGVPEMHITVSVGVTTFPDNGYAEHEIVRVADQALFRAKGSGRNLVCCIGG